MISPYRFSLDHQWPGLIPNANCGLRIRFSVADPIAAQNASCDASRAQGGTLQAYIEVEFDHNLRASTGTLKRFNFRMQVADKDGFTEFISHSQNSS